MAPVPSTAGRRRWRRAAACAAAGRGAAAAASWRESSTVAYPHYPGRQVFVLSGEWDFAFLGDVDLAAAVHVREEDLCRRVAVPDAFDAREWLCAADSLAGAAGTPGPAGGAAGRGCGGDLRWPCGRCCELARGPLGDDDCWNESENTFSQCCDPVSLGRRGIAAYRTRLPHAVALLHFQACALHCTVLINRRIVAEHDGGYSPFWVDVPPAAAAASRPQGAAGDTVELLVLADNRFDPSRPLHQPYFDWYQPGGLLRPVEAHVLRDAEHFLRGVQVRPLGGAGAVELRLRLATTAALGGGPGPPLRAAWSFDGGAQAEPRRLVAAEDAWVLAVPSPRTWSPQQPHLHVVTVALLLGELEVDRVIVRFGLRDVQAVDGQVLVNGRPVMLRGANRHESHPHGGIWMSEQQLHRDIALLRELNANFVRGSHYSQDQRFLDLCDEAGIFVWEETVGWQASLEHLQDPTFVEQQLLSLEETINASINHPSVLMWGFLNEAQTDDLAARPIFELLASRARQLDPSRLVTWASKTKLRDVTLDLADVISFNDYPGWYDSSVDEVPLVWKSYADWARQHFPGKPVLIGEAGASGLSGFRSPRQLAKWSEDLQAAIMLASVVAMHVAGFAGLALWQFADCRIDTSLFFEENPRASPFENVSDADWVEHVAIKYETTNSPYGRGMPLRPRRQNNKGLVSLDRGYRKQAFYAVRDAFRWEPCLLAGSSGADLLALAAARAERGAAAWGRLPEQPRALRLQAVGSAGLESGPCPGCFLAVHTWNAADRPESEPGVRVHGHSLEARASLWSLDAAGLLRLAGHADGRPTALGWHLGAAPGPARGSRAVVREAPSALWRAEAAGEGEVLVRMALGDACGFYLVLDASDSEDVRDESSVFVSLQADRAAATVWRVLPATAAV